jgi:hypothetical protein
MDSGSWQFRVADVDELARRRGLGSDPELSLSDLELEVPDGSGSDEFDLSEFHMGANKADLGAKTSDLMKAPTDSSEQDIQVDDLSLPPGPVLNSSSTIIGMKPPGKAPSDSDVRIVSDTKPVKSTSDSDVRLMPVSNFAPGGSEVSLAPPGGSIREPNNDAEITLVNDDPAMPGLGYPSGSGSEHGVGSIADFTPVDEAESGSDFELMPSTDIAAALQPESGSDFELTALDSSDEFDTDSTTLKSLKPASNKPSDSDVTAAQPSESGVNLARPSDSGINLQGIGGFDLSADSIELAPLDDEEPARPAPKKKPAAAGSPGGTVLQKPDPGATSLGASPSPGATAIGKSPGATSIGKSPGATSLGMKEKDIFEDTDFSLEVDGLDSDHDDRTVQLDRSSDFDLEEVDSGSEVFALDEDDVDQNAATAMGGAVADAESGEFGAGSDEMSNGWDVESEGAATPSSAASPAAAARLVPAGPQAEWGGIWVGLLGFSTVLVFLSGILSIDLVRNLYDFQGGSPASGLIKSISGLFFG